MRKESDFPEIQEAYAQHQEVSDNLKSLRKKYKVPKRAREIELLRKIVETKTGKRIKKNMKVQRDFSFDLKVPSDFDYFVGLVVKKAFLTGKISTLNGRTMRKKNGKYLYIRDYKKLQFIEVPREPGTCCICGRKTRLSSHHVVPRRLTKEKGLIGNLRMRICGRCHRAIHPENEFIHHLREFLEKLEFRYGEDSLKECIDNYGLVKRMSERGFNDE